MKIKKSIENKGGFELGSDKVVDFDLFAWFLAWEIKLKLFKIIWLLLLSGWISKEMSRTDEIK